MLLNCGVGEDSWESLGLQGDPTILKEIGPGISLEGMMLKLKLQYFGHLMQRVDSDAGRDWGQEEKGTTEDEMARWYHWLNGRESEWTPGVGDGQGCLACCDSWGHKESDTTERLNWTELISSGSGFLSCLNAKSLMPWIVPRTKKEVNKCHFVDLLKPGLHEH